MAAYYNEFDPFAAAWLRELIKAGHIADGDVDERSIEDVVPNDLMGYTQCHFFAGIGGWSYALRLAKWPDNRPVWTGSCPCQPFSSAGNQKGKADPRHLWPAWFGLIRECQPPVIFGEQVAAAIAKGWFDDVCEGMERENYAIGAAVLPAVGVGRGHRRDRLWFVADCSSKRRDRSETSSRSTGRLITESNCGFVGNAKRQRPSGSGKVGESLCSATSYQRETNQPLHVGPSFKWYACGDGKQRPVEPSIPLLAHGVSGRVGKLRGLGNAIVPQVAQSFIEAYISLENRQGGQ